MSYSAPNRLLLPMRQSIDNIEGGWMPSIVTAYNDVATWPTANMAIYVPILVPSRVVVVKLWFASGSTGTGNVDMGLYDASGNAVVSATAAAKITSANEQIFDVTDTPVGPGRYYVALSASNNTDTFTGCLAAAPIAAGLGLLTEASAYPLPATATMVIDQTLGFVPSMGVLLEGTAT
jgi:hypothetical protein